MIASRKGGQIFREMRLTCDFREKIGNKILLLVVIICALQMFASIVIYGISYQGRKEEIIRENVRILEQANNNYLSMIISEMENSTRDIFYDEVFWDTNNSEELEGQIYSILANKLHTMASINSIYLFCSKTDKLYMMDEASFLGIPVKIEQSNLFSGGYEDISQAEWFVEAQKKEGKMAVTRNPEMRGGNEYMISFSRYLKYPLLGNEDYYAVTINIESSFFYQLEKQVCEADEKFFLLDDQGNYIYFGDSVNYHGTVENGLAGTQDWFKAKMSGTSYIGIKNTSKEYSWTMLKLIPEKRILKNMTQTMLLNCCIIFLIFIAGFLFLKKSIRRITLPIENLAEIMRNYQQGVAFEDGGMSSRKDEIGILYQSYQKMHDRIEELIESEYKSQILEKEARLEALQAQIDPHFLYNTLQTISGIAIEKNVYEIEEINNHLSRMLRYSLSKKKSLVKLEEELDNIKSYMYIQKYRYGDRIHLEWDLSEGILQCQVPVFTLQLAVENSMKHGLETKVGPGMIRIYNDRISEYMQRIFVEDNGVGMTEEKLSEINRMLHDQPEENPQTAYDRKGLKNLNERLKQQFGQEYGIELKNNQREGAVLIIYIP